MADSRLVRADALLDWLATIGWRAFIDFRGEVSYGGGEQDDQSEMSPMFVDLSDLKPEVRTILEAKEEYGDRWRAVLGLPAAPVG